MDDVDLLERLANGGSLLHGVFCRHVRRPELCADAPLAQSRNIGMELLLRFANVNPAQVAAALSPQVPREIVMPIHENGAAVDPQGFVRNLYRSARRL